MIGFPSERITQYNTTNIMHLGDAIGGACGRNERDENVYKRLACIPEGLLGEVDADRTLP
jgi:hypothetical protein